MFSSSSWASRDTQQYLNHYPDQRDNPRLNDNLLFYSNQLPSRPDGGLIEDILTDWRGQYNKLERHHGFVQWLFPLREEGMNSLIHPLQPHELAAIQQSQPCRQRFLRSYELMLDFYGFEPSASFGSTGAIRLVAVARLRNLISSTHNYLRVTRILKSMGEFGYEQLKLGLVLALWRESRGERGTQYMRRSCDEYWSAVLRDERDREVVEQVRRGTVSVKQQDEYEAVLTARADDRRGQCDAEKEEAVEQKRSAEVELESKNNKRLATGPSTCNAGAVSSKQTVSRPEGLERKSEQDEDKAVDDTAAAQEIDEVVRSSVDEKYDSNEVQPQTSQQSVAKRKTQSTVPMSQEL